LSKHTRVHKIVGLLYWEHKRMSLHKYNKIVGLLYWEHKR
jgi:hypothetical protein